jgi:hypothetical protein
MEVHYHVHKILPLDRITGPFSPGHISFEIHFNVILSRAVASREAFPFSLQIKPFFSEILMPLLNFTN